MCASCVPVAPCVCWPLHNAHISWSWDPIYALRAQAKGKRGRWARARAYEEEGQPKRIKVLKFIHFDTKRHVDEWRTQYEWPSLVHISYPEITNVRRSKMHAKSLKLQMCRLDNGEQRQDVLVSDTPASNSNTQQQQRKMCILLIMWVMNSVFMNGYGCRLLACAHSLLPNQNNNKMKHWMVIVSERFDFKSHQTMNHLQQLMHTHTRTYVRSSQHGFSPSIFCYLDPGCAQRWWWWNVRIPQQSWNIDRYTTRTSGCLVSYTLQLHLVCVLEWPMADVREMVMIRLLIVLFCNKIFLPQRMHAGSHRNCTLSMWTNAAKDRQPCPGCVCPKLLLFYW